MTIKADIAAITPTAGAIAAANAAGSPIIPLIEVAMHQARELETILKQIVSLTPAGDANRAALDELLEQLA